VIQPELIVLDSLLFVLSRSDFIPCFWLSAFQNLTRELTMREGKPLHAVIVLVPANQLDHSTGLSFAYLIFLTKFHLSQKCWTRSTTLGPAMVIEVSCHAAWSATAAFEVY